MVWLRRGTTGLLVAFGLAAPATAAEVGVIVSIAPVHSLVAGVMEGVGEPYLLVRGMASEHAYALKPSDATAMEGADVVFWIGEGLETFLIGPIENLAGSARSVELGEVPGLVQLSYREGGIWARHEHGGEHDEADDDHAEHNEDEDHHEGEGHDEDHAGRDEGHAHHGTDPHLWLDPANARAMVAAVADALAAVDPANAARYEANRAALDTRLVALKAELAGTLAPAQGIPFIVFHDAYQYLEHRYGLTAAGSVTIDPEHRPSAERIADIRDIIEERSAVCVFSEPQFGPELVEVIIEGTGALAGHLDPIGADIEPGVEHYFTLMRRNADALAGCLSN